MQYRRNNICHDRFSFGVEDLVSFALSYFPCSSGTSDLKKKITSVVHFDKLSVLAHPKADLISLFGHFIILASFFFFSDEKSKKIRKNREKQYLR